MSFSYNSCSKMYSQTPLNRAFNNPNPWMKEDLLDFHFPNENGVVEKSLLGEYTMDEIRQLTRRADRRRASQIAKSQTSPFQTSQSSLQSGSSSSISGQSTNPFGNIFGTSPAHSQASSTSTVSSYRSICSATSHGSGTQPSAG